ncbi:hypothetical protein [Clostridium sp. YIM B02551]|uniref:hypothetical protein n=1 Tax=Clostridium sp. YIM B02551 TaxID=2910679 RepID=UPI001EEB5E15|nr:hypothetical protein [Clostridium sp. YIM B02551]
MKLLIYESAYRLLDFDKGEFDSHESYIKNIADIIQCFTCNSVILFPIQEKIFYDEEYELNRTFIKERIQFRNNFWMYNIPIDDKESPNIIWYGVRNAKEVIEVLEFSHDFDCAIVSENSKIEEAIYLLNFNEDDEFNSLTIREKNEGDFINKIVPKLEKLFNEKIIME